MRNWLWGLAVIAACGGGAPHANLVTVQFECRNRVAGYDEMGGMAGAEVGVQMDCKDNGPRIERWRTDSQGRHVTARSMTAAEFDKVWKQIDGTGWPNLSDCTNGSLGKNDPVFKFTVSDDQNHASFSCQTVNVPYPYDDITNALNFAAQSGNMRPVGATAGGAAP